LVEKLRKPSTQVKFVKPPPVHASSKQKNAALIEKLAAIVAPAMFHKWCAEGHLSPKAQLKTSKSHHTGALQYPTTQPGHTFWSFEAAQHPLPTIARCRTAPPRPRSWRSARRRPLLLAGPRPPERGAPLNYAAKHLRKGVQPGDTGAARLHQRTQQEREKQGVLQLPPAPHGRAPLRGRPRGMSAISPVK
jgi:hypothetical protein